MTAKEIAKSVGAQREYFSKHETKNIEYRRGALEQLRKGIVAHEKDIFDALHADFKKSAFETYATEVGQVLEELRSHIRNIRRWTKNINVGSPIAHFPSKSWRMYEPYGTALIMSPWNYPFALTVLPMAGAISAGNCIAVKPSEFSPNTSEIIDRIVTEAFPPEYIRVYQGDIEVNKALLKEHFDYIFFTGSPAVGKIVMQAASAHLTPVTLELGGKSPCIVDDTASIDLAAKRIVWGKFINAGQTCIAPDYVFVHESMKDALVEKIRKYIRKFYGEDVKKSPDFPRIINDRQYERLTGLMKDGKIIAGGTKDKKSRYIEPTIIEGMQDDSPLMSEEIFGPIMPLKTFSGLDSVIAFVNSRPKPLALYMFSNSRANIDTVLRQTSSGGVTINDTIIHAGNPQLPFGGIGNSGMGAYHGKSSFELFSHLKPVMRKSNLIDVPLRYPPYSDSALNLVKKVLR